MNFDNMPELHWRFGYPLVIVIVLIACSLLYRRFKRSGWLLARSWCWTHVRRQGNGRKGDQHAQTQPKRA
jgi:hypothetical protein